MHFSVARFDTRGSNISKYAYVRTSYNSNIFKDDNYDTIMNVSYIAKKNIANSSLSKFVYSDKSNSSRIDVSKTAPPVYIITPTKSRSEQIADLLRLCYTLKLAGNIVWIVVEDSQNKSKQIADQLEECVGKNVGKLYPHSENMNLSAMDENRKYHFARDPTGLVYIHLSAASQGFSMHRGLLRNR